MKILAIHSDFIEYKPLTKALRSAEEVSLESTRVEECLVVFTSIEDGDTEVVVENTKKEIVRIALQLGVKKIVIYPFVHLSANPAKPDVALEFLKEMENLGPGYEVFRSPFGWYKSFNIKAKGHPLSELSRSFSASDKTSKKDDEDSAALKAEENLKNKFMILTAEGETVEIDKFDFTGHENLRKFVDYEMKKLRVYKEEPPHIKIMKSHHLVEYEPASDGGHFRWLPSGLVMKKTLEAIITNWCKEMGAVQVETPIMYDQKHPALASYLSRFPARRYIVESDDKKLFLRFSACFGQFLALRDAVISYTHLPFRMYELTHYSFRREQSGELAGLKRLRAFTMPDMHTLCKNTKTAQKEFEAQFNKSLEWNKMLSLEIEAAFRAQTDYFNKHKAWYQKMMKNFGKPALLELFDERYAYFITKFEFNFIDNMDKASALSTVQIDVENAETYDITFTDKDGKKKRPIILHASISGSIDRVMYAILENEAAKIARGETPMFPFMLAPTQVRIIPFSGESKIHMKAAKNLAKKLAKKGVRADIDDRNEKMGKRIRDSQVEWVPYTIVIGDKEIKEGILPVKNRKTGQVENKTEKEFIKEVADKMKDYPKETLSLPILISKRPIF